MSKEEYISQYKYLGKTIKEWEEEAKTADGLDEDGNPYWWGAQANATYGRVYAIVSYENQNKKMSKEIKLPSKKEIKKHIDSLPYYGHCTDEYKEGFEDGIEWIKQQIKNQNKDEKIIRK